MRRTHEKQGLPRVYGKIQAEADHGRLHHTRCRLRGGAGVGVPGVRGGAWAGGAALLAGHGLPGRRIPGGVRGGGQPAFFHPGKDPGVVSGQGNQVFSVCAQPDGTERAENRDAGEPPDLRCGRGLRKRRKGPDGLCDQPGRRGDGAPDCPGAGAAGARGQPGGRRKTPGDKAPP